LGLNQAETMPPYDFYVFLSRIGLTQALAQTLDEAIYGFIADAIGIGFGVDGGYNFCPAYDLA
jgi:hypothetical protein